MSSQTYIKDYLKGIIAVTRRINPAEVASLISELLKLKNRKGRLFLLGVGGSAANCSHAVNDFRKICHIETYTPVDNVAELTARVNDEGWETVFINWLKGSRLNKKDAVLVFSVGGGNSEKNISVNIIFALDYAKKVGASILGIVGRDGGYTKKVADACVLVPVVVNSMITPYSEAFQAVLWHLLVNYPDLLGEKY